jgi:hypothetical protein
VFNPRRFASRYKLYQEFSAWVAKHGVKLLTVEIAFGERAHAATSSDPWHLQLRTRHEMWHKERALNCGLARLHQVAPGWQYVAWMDADVKLVRDDWAQEAVHLLQHYAVLQLFSEARSLGPHYESIFSCRSIAANYRDYGRVDWGTDPGLASMQQYARRGHPGLGWAFRRDELERVGGWLDVCINGSGDLHMAGCYTGQPLLAMPVGISRGYREAVLRYGERCDRYMRCNTSCMPGACDHYWHGRSRHRGYEDRWKLLVKYQFDPALDLSPDSQGLWRWNLDDRRVLALASETRASLAARNEDGNEL